MTAIRPTGGFPKRPPNLADNRRHRLSPFATPVPSEKNAVKTVRLAADHTVSGVASTTDSATKMVDPRWPDRTFRKPTLKEQTERIADRYEIDIYGHAGQERSRWFYEYGHTRFTVEAQVTAQLGETALVNKPKKQGTSHETGTVVACQAKNIPAGRYAEGGSSDLGDVWIGQPYLDGDPNPIVAVYWKRLVNKEGQTRRAPDGDRDVIVIAFNDFLDILTMTTVPNVTVECKATQQLNVTRTLANTRRKAHRKDTT